jgi:hypothetical protein
MVFHRLQAAAVPVRNGGRGRKAQAGRWRSRMEALRLRLLPSRASMYRRRAVLAPRSTSGEQLAGGALLGSGMVLMAAWFLVVNHQRLGAALGGLYRTLFV